MIHYQAIDSIVHAVLKLHTYIRKKIKEKITEDVKLRNVNLVDGNKC